MRTLMFWGFWASLGAVQSLAFSVRPSPLVAWVAWVPVAWLAIDASRSKRLGRRVLAAWWSGWMFWLCTIPWIAYTISTHGGLPVWLGAVLLGLLAAYMALYQAAFVAVAGRLHPPGGSVSAWIFRAAVLASLWATLEWTRERLFSGFPWAPLGEAVVGTPGALELAPWIGGRGLSIMVMVWSVVLARLIDAAWRTRFLVGGTGAAADLLSERRSAERLWIATAGLILLLLVGGFAQEKRTVRWSIAEVSQDQPESAPAGEGWWRTVRVVQPNVPILRDGTEFVRNYQRLLDLSRCNVPGTLIVWPESAAFPLLWERHQSLRDDIRSIVSHGCDLLFNSAISVETEEGPGVTNAALLATWREEEGQVDVQRYDKMHLVPYGEYVPLKNLLPFVRQLARSVGEFEHGEQLNLLHWGDLDLGLSICFEIVFPYEVAARSRAGADLLAVITNDAWFGLSAAPAQHLVSARMRAAENRRPLVFAATTGISAVIDERGRVQSSLPLGEAGALELILHRRGDRAEPDDALGDALDLTLYSRAPWLVDLVAAVLVVLGFLGGGEPSRRRGEQRAADL